MSPRILYREKFVLRGRRIQCVEVAGRSYDIDVGPAPGPRVLSRSDSLEEALRLHKERERRLDRGRA